MTAVQFAKEMDVDYSTVMRWLKNGVVPDAEQVEPIAGMKVWQIPQSALKMARPLAGRKRRTKGDGTVKAAKKARGKTSQKAKSDL